MISIEQWYTIRNLHSKGYGIKTIARMLSISKNTVKKALVSNEYPKYQRIKEVKKKIDRFSDAIIDMYYNKDYIGTRIFEEIKKVGYEGSINGVYRFLNTLEKKTPKKTSMRYETDMGKQAQFDWSPYTVNINGRKVNIILYSMILSYSREKAVCVGFVEKAATVKEILNLSGLYFIDKKENVILIGPPGVGKTHLSIALGIKACKAKYRVLFSDANTLIEELYTSTVDNTISEKLESLSRLDLLIIDELGYMPVNKEKANLFFQLISKRYKAGSIILTTNLPFDQWDTIFGDPVISSAIIDRVAHHCHIISINGNSYRMKDKLHKDYQGGQN